MVCFWAAAWSLSSSMQGNNKTRKRTHANTHCPVQEAYLDVTLPVLGATLRALEAEHCQASFSCVVAVARFAAGSRGFCSRRRHAGWRCLLRVPPCLATPNSRPP